MQIPHYVGMSNFAMGTILGKGFAQALLHVCTCAFGTCAKPFSQDCPNGKLDIHHD